MSRASDHKAQVQKQRQAEREKEESAKPKTEERAEGPIPPLLESIPPKPRHIGAWLELSRPIPADTIKRREALGLVSDIVLAAIFGVLPMPVVWRWIGWALCWCGFVYLLLELINPLNRLPSRTRIAIAGILFVLFTVAVARPAHSMWRAEKAATLEGYISAGHITEDTQLFLDFGDPESSIDLRYKGAEQFRFLYDAGLRIDVGKYGPEISTPIRDTDGHLIAEINKNHWQVSPSPLCWDKNYTDNSLEVQDSGGHVVFQVTLFPNRVRLKGEWHDKFGHGVRVDNRSLSFWQNREQEMKIEKLIAPLFKYPSAEHWGELAVSSGGK